MYMWFWSRPAWIHSANACNCRRDGERIPVSWVNLGKCFVKWALFVLFLREKYCILPYPPQELCVLHAISRLPWLGLSSSWDGLLDVSGFSSRYFNQMGSLVPDQRFSGPFYLVCLNSAVPLEPETSTRWSLASQGHAWILLNNMFEKILVHHHSQQN